MQNIWKNSIKSQSKTKQNHSIIADLSPKEENLTKGMTHSFRSNLNNCIINAEVVVRHPIKIGKNNAQLGDIFAKSAADIIITSQCVAKYQNFPKSKNRHLWMNWMKIV